APLSSALPQFDSDSRKPTQSPSMKQRGKSANATTLLGSTCAALWNSPPFPQQDFRPQSRARRHELVRPALPESCHPRDFPTRSSDSIGMLELDLRRLLLADRWWLLPRMRTERPPFPSAAAFVQSLPSFSGSGPNRLAPPPQLFRCVSPA